MNIEVNREDFDHLWSVAMPWAPHMHADDGGWYAQIVDGRFVVPDGSPVDRTMDMAYWFRERAQLILARSYVVDQNESYQVVGDEAEMFDGDGLPWVLLTNLALHAT